MSCRTVRQAPEPTDTALNNNLYASSHRVGKCGFEPSKQLRIRKSSF